MVERQLGEVIKSTAEARLSGLQAGSLAHLFITQQLQYREGGGNAMRWHPTMIRWALSIQAKSSSTYLMMCESGMLCLPSDRTLNDFKSCRPFVAGIDYDLITQHASTYANTDYTLMLDERKMR